MRPVRMGCYDKGILAFCKTESQLLSQSVRFLRCDLAGFEGLTDLLSNHFMPLAAAGDLVILAFGQHEFFIHGHGIALIPGDQFTLVRLLRILRIIRSVAQTLGEGFFLYSHAWVSVLLLPWESAPFSNLCKRKDLRRINSSGPLSYDSS